MAIFRRCRVCRPEEPSCNQVQPSPLRSRAPPLSTRTRLPQACVRSRTTRGNLLKTLPIVPGVRVDSIVTVDGEGDPQDLDDGVVSYASQHQPDAESEIVVRSFHTCLSNPRVIDEVRRILLASLKPPDSE